MSIPSMPTFCKRDPCGNMPIRSPFSNVLNNNRQNRRISKPSVKPNHINNTDNQHAEQTNYLQHSYYHPVIEHERRQKITINVSGERYQTFVDTLDRFPETLLGNSFKREEFYDDVEDEYFFDRDRTAFNAILYYYQSFGELYCPLTVPMTILVTEAKFFQLGNDALKQVLDLKNEGSTQSMPKNKWKKRIWCLFEHPETSSAAHFLTLFSVLMILFSVTILCVETLPEFRIPNDKIVGPNTLENTQINFHGAVLEMFLNNMTKLTTSPGVNLTIKSKTRFHAQHSQYCFCECSLRLRNQNQNRIDKENNMGREIQWKEVFQICETVFTAWFTFEYLIRFTSAPDRVKFIKEFLNIIDVISILPFYITTALNRHDGYGIENFRVIRLVRVFRIFKLSRHSKGLQILGLTLRESMKELGLMVFFLAIGVILFSSAVYYLETENFTSIPDAFWWAIITMCTVGYGDKVPKTFWGKLVGSACSVCGVLSIALPVPVIVSNFDYFYNRERTKKMHEAFLDDTESNKSTPQRLNPKVTPSETFETERNHTDLLLNDKKLSLDYIHRPYLNDSSPVSPRHKNGSVKSATETRTDEIHRQATIKGLEKRNRKLSQRLSESSMLHLPLSKNSSAHTIEKESFM